MAKDHRIRITDGEAKVLVEGLNLLLEKQPKGQYSYSSDFHRWQAINNLRRRLLRPGETDVRRDRFDKGALDENPAP